MLTVAKVTGSQAGGYADYLEGKTTASQPGDYYLKDGERVEAVGRWVTGAQAVGADPAARVSGEQLRTLMDVRRPDTGQPLRPVGSTGEAVAALDATFSAPKSISAVWALADPDLRERVEQAHESAINRALTYATGQVAMVRERLDARTVIHAKAREMVATGWRHTTARSVDGQPPDPQLHTHVLIHGAVRRDGQIAAIDSRQWFTHRRELGAAYRTELARELTTLGFQITRGTGRGGRYFEIAGIPTALTDRWSSRHHQVQEAIQARLHSRRTELQETMDAGGINAAWARKRLAQLNSSAQLSAEEDRFLTHATRTTKQPVTRRDLDIVWTKTAADLGLTTHNLLALQATDRPLLTPDPVRLEAQLTEHDATLTRSHARTIALEQSAGVPIRDALTQLAQMRDTDRLLTLADGTLTTHAHRTREQQTAALAARLAAADVDPIPPGLVERNARRLEEELHAHNGSLSAEQRAALTLACANGQLVVIEGQAGTGKSTLLTGVARAHEAAGQQVIVTSTAALAAQRLADELTTAGVHPAAHSTVSLAHAIAEQRITLDPASTIIHDEAALASTRELHGLLDSAEASGARLILIGDPQHSHAVGAGGLWATIETASRENDGHVELTRNLRARDPQDARDQSRFRHGEHETALGGYADRDRLRLTPTQQDAEDAALDAAHRDQRDGHRTLVIAQTTNDHLDELNARAQAIRHQDGQIGADSLPLTGRPYELHAGDEIQLRASIPHPDHGALRNGTTATVTALDPDAGTAGLTLGDLRKVTLTHDQLDQAQARLGYVQHPFPAQSTTTDTTHLIIAEHPTREGTYVALTRARDHTHLYAATDQLDPEQPALPQLAQRVSATQPDLPSIAQPLAHEHAITTQLDDASVLAAAVERRDGITDRQAGAVTSMSVRDPAPRPRELALTAPGPVTRASIAQTYESDSYEHPSAIAAYRIRYAIPDSDPRPLGPVPPAGAFRQRLDRRHAARDTLDTLQRGDHHHPDPLLQKLVEAEASEPDRGYGRSTIEPER
jgi:conjugative relaxase-like TrwC/TraI family protein